MKKDIIFKYLLTLIFLIPTAQNYSSNNSLEHVENNKWNSQINEFEAWDMKNSFPQDAVLFIGGSNIRLWNTRPAFADFPVINRGFGGAQIPDIIYFHKRIIFPYKPSIIVFLAGGDDLASARSPLEVMNDFKSLSQKVLAGLPESEMIVLSIKPAPARQNLWPSCIQANKYLNDLCSYDTRLTFIDTSSCLLNKDGSAKRDYFTDNMLDLSEKGYDRWISILSPVLRKHYDKNVKKQNSVNKAELLPAEFFASKNSKVFHRSDCPSVKRISQANLIKFSTRQQALDSGRRPCKTCNP